MTQEEQPISKINSHIEEYLDYYCGLSHVPGFAVLLKGEWGCGKTWFINKYREKIKKKKQKFLYVSLYGMTSFTEIEDTFFQQLHPRLSSKGMVITRQVLKGLLKGTLKIDLDGDKKDDGSIIVQIPDIDLSEHLKNTDGNILIFDDLERSQIDIINLLGYINHFVEHQGLKVILLANEKKLLKIENYKETREKLIGKSLEVFHSIHEALTNFILEIDNQDVKTILSENIQIIENSYHGTKYENLRTLRQVTLDFERIFLEMPEIVRKNKEVLIKILNILTVLSIEIKKGSLKSSSIYKLTHLEKNEARSQEDKDEPEILLLKKKFYNHEYPFKNLLISTPFPNLSWWYSFFDKGIFDKNNLQQSIVNSQYFQDEYTPNWLKLYYFVNLSDSEFQDLLQKVQKKYSQRKFTELTEVILITLLFLYLCDARLLLSKSKRQLLEDAKKYIDHLITIEKIDLTLQEYTPNLAKEAEERYQELPKYGEATKLSRIKLQEFQDFLDYLREARKLAMEQSMPIRGQRLLSMMKSNIDGFCTKVGGNKKRPYQEFEYRNVPIFKYIKPDAFIENLFSLKFEDRQLCCYSIYLRYNPEEFAFSINYETVEERNSKLIEELEFLNKIKSFLAQEIQNKEKRFDRYKLEVLKNQYISKAIEGLESAQQD